MSQENPEVVRLAHTLPTHETDSMVAWVRYGCTVILAVVLAMPLVGCGEDEPEGGPGTYTARNARIGTSYTLVIPAPDDDKQVQRMERFHVRLGADTGSPLKPQSYGVLSIDNTRGNYTIQPARRVITLITEGGKRVTMHAGHSVLGQCTARRRKCSRFLYNEEVEISNSLSGPDRALPGRKARTPVVAEQKVAFDDVRRVFLGGVTTGGERVEMKKR